MMQPNTTSNPDNQDSENESFDIPDIIIDDQPFDDVHWNRLRREFDRIKDVDEIYYKLAEILSEFKVCTTTNCEVFPELHKLDLARLNFPEYKSMEEAKANITNKYDLNIYQKTYHKYIIFAKHIINKIFALKVRNDSNKQDQDEKDAKFLNYLKICAKYGLTPEMEIQKGIKDVANAYAGASLPLNKEEKTDKLRLEEHVRKISDKEREKVKEKERQKGATYIEI